MPPPRTGPGGYTPLCVDKQTENITSPRTVYTGSNERNWTWVEGGGKHNPPMCIALFLGYWGQKIDLKFSWKSWNFVKLKVPHFFFNWPLRAHKWLRVSDFDTFIEGYNFTNNNHMDLNVVFLESEPCFPHFRLKIIVLLENEYYWWKLRNVIASGSCSFIVFITTSIIYSGACLSFPHPS